MYILTEVEEFLCKQIVDCAYQVHSKLGPGLLEKIYEVCFCHELSKQDIPFRRQVQLPIVYDGVVFDEGLKLDVLVDEKIICEFKAVDIVNPLASAGIKSFKPNWLTCRICNKFQCAIDEKWFEKILC